MKKYLVVFIVLLFSLAAHSQNFVNSAQAVDIVKAEKVSDLSQLESMDPVSEPYAQIKLQLSSYDLLVNQLQGNDDVAEAVRLTVTELGSGISRGDYEQNAIDDPRYQALKEHLIQLLTQ